MHAKLNREIKMTVTFYETCYLCGKIFDSLHEGRMEFMKEIGRFVSVCDEPHSTAKIMMVR